MDDGQSVPAHDSIKWSLVVTVFYGFSSGSMNFINKFVLSVWSFHAPTTIMFSQMVMLSLGLRLLKKSGRVVLVQYDQDRARTFLPLTVIYSINAVICKLIKLLFAVVKRVYYKLL